LHGMAYYIFLKSWRSLEEFRKNLHLKIPPKSPSTNFQSLGKFKNPIFIRKEFFSQNSTHPSQPRPCWPAPHRRPPRTCARPIPACVALAYLPKVVSSSSLRSPATTPSPSVTAKRAPPVSSIFHLASADPGHAVASPHLSRPPRATQPLPRDAKSRS
jgi:hypothetical protein